jgi:hypothetical protein
VNDVVLKDYCWNADGTLSRLTEYLEPGNLTRTRVTNYSYQAGSGGLNVSELRVTGSDGSTRRVTFTYDSLRIPAMSVHRSGCMPVHHSGHVGPVAGVGALSWPRGLRSRHGLPWQGP